MEVMIMNKDGKFYNGSNRSWEKDPIKGTVYYSKRVYDVVYSIGDLSLKIVDSIDYIR